MKKNDSFVIAGCDGDNPSSAINAAILYINDVKMIKLVFIDNQAIKRLKDIKIPENAKKVFVLGVPMLEKDWPEIHDFMSLHQGKTFLWVNNQPGSMKQSEFYERNDQNVAYDFEKKSSIARMLQDINFFVPDHWLWAANHFWQPKKNRPNSLVKKLKQECRALKAKKSGKPIIEALELELNCCQKIFHELVAA